MTALPELQAGSFISYCLIWLKRMCIFSSCQMFSINFSQRIWDENSKSGLGMRTAVKGFIFTKTGVEKLRAESWSKASSSLGLVNRLSKQPLELWPPLQETQEQRAPPSGPQKVVGCWIRNCGGCWLWNCRCYWLWNYRYHCRTGFTVVGIRAGEHKKGCSGKVKDIWIGWNGILWIRRYEDSWSWTLRKSTHRANDSRTDETGDSEMALMGMRWLKMWLNATNNSAAVLKIRGVSVPLQLSPIVCS